MYFSRWATRSSIKALVGVAVSLSALSPCRAEVIDRIVAVVEGHIITLSDVREEREIRTRLGETNIPEDKVLAKDLVDRHLVERQIADYPNVDATEAEVDQSLRSMIQNGVITNAIRNAVRQRIRMQKFFVDKFGESIQPTDEQIRKYYVEIFVPAAQARGLDPIPPLTDPDVASGVRQNLIHESLDHEVTVWLEAIRRRSNIEVFD
jgi:hypothetical protein